MRQRIAFVSSLLAIVGLFLLYVSLESAHDFWHQLSALFAAALVNTGAVSLIFEFVNLRKLVREDIVDALFMDEKYLSSLSQDELLRQMDRFIEARHPQVKGIDKSIVGWLVNAIIAPARQDYHVDIKLLAKAGSTLLLEAQITYQTAQNNSGKQLLINGDGVIDTLFKVIPEDTELARRYRRNRELPEGEILDLAKEMFDPTVDVSTDGPGHRHRVDTEIKLVSLVDTANDQLAIAIDITSKYKLEPGQKASIRYTHKQQSYVNDAYVWSASALTYDFDMRLFYFDGYALVPIANPTAKSNINALDILSDTIRCRGTILPQSSFAFSWSPEAASPVAVAELLELE
jgi:hypothetical protein